MAGLIDTNVLVYRFDPRFPEKQSIATSVLRGGIERDDLRLPHQSIIEFAAVVSRPIGGGAPLLERSDALQEAEALLSQFEVLYPNEALVRLALRGAAAYQLSWFDAHLWAYAEYFGLDELISEDFSHGRMYGTVRAVNPFAESD